MKTTLRTWEELGIEYICKAKLAGTMRKVIIKYLDEKNNGNL